MICERSKKKLRPIDREALEAFAVNGIIKGKELRAR
jgi:hypothetical protein